MIILQHKTKKRFWSIVIKDNALVMSYGQIGGKLTERIKYIEQKNIGKSNETTIEQQAINEMISLVKQKIDEGYELIEKTSYNEIDNYKKSECYFPMLANKYSEKLIKNKTIHIQTKLDGVRCIATYENNQVVLRTRKGKLFIDLYEIKSDLEKVFKLYPDLILDGEIYKHNWDFNRIVSACKARNNDTPELEYHIFDCIEENSFKDRYEKLFNITNKEFIKIKIVYALIEVQDIINNIDNYLQVALEDNYEGIMIRVDDCKYIQNKRSNQLLKYKLFQDEEFEIIGYEKELLNNMEYGVIYKVKDDMGNKFNVRPKGDVQSRIDALKNIENNIGKMLTVRFQNKSEDFIPRFPVGIGIRID